MLYSSRSESEIKKIEKVVMTFDKDKTEDEKAKNKSNEDE